MGSTARPDNEPSTVERQSLCLSTSESLETIHAGEAGFTTQLDRHFARSENNSAERLVKLKNELRVLKAEAFWSHLMEGLADVCQAQFAFVSKRILVNDHDSAVEMPPIGEAGSCLMGVALYWNDGKGSTNLSRDYKYYAWGAPCSYMKHDKVFLCPEGISALTPDNPNQLPFACDAYLGIPLFADGKCFAHFGLMWTKEGLEQKNLSWGYLEMLLHSVEDLITDRLLAGHGFAKDNVDMVRAQPVEPAGKLIPVESVTAAQSLRPYARSLSHELRTPMQGVVGMLDVMHATVQEQIEGATNVDLMAIFRTLKDSIETVQDSSKRAVEAADNIVHAYDLNMQVPETPFNVDMDSPAGLIGGYFESRPKMFEGSNIFNPHKRRREPEPWSFGSPNKVRHIDHSETPRSPLARGGMAKPISPIRHTPFATPDEPFLPRQALLTPSDMDSISTPSGRQANIRDLIPVIINDALRVGGRPDSAISEPIPLGERIEVRTRSSNGHASQKTIEWRVEEDVPDFVAMDERDLTKLISQVFLNSNKYTEIGIINLHARLSKTRRYVTINVIDTGSGIPRDFQPELFKAFAKEDHSITRTKEGLGLGLLVAKGVARRVGGDIVLVRSSTEGPNRGTEFEIRVPLDSSGLPDSSAVPSRSTTPLRPSPDPTTSRASNATKSNTSAPGLRDRSSSPQLLSSPTKPPVLPVPLMSQPSLSTPHVPTMSNIISAAGQFANGQSPAMSAVPRSLTKPTPRRTISSPITKKDLTYDRELAKKHPLTFLVAEDNKINRKLLVNMLNKFGYRDVYEAFDGKEAVRIMDSVLRNEPPNKGSDLAKAVDVVLMDLWMPEMDGYEATEKILAMFENMKIAANQQQVSDDTKAPIILAVSADVTEAAVDRATRIGMQGYMTKPYMLTDLQRLITEFCARPIQVA